MTERRWAWLLPALTLALGTSLEVDADGMALRAVVGAWFLLSLGVGVAWQLLYRRDVADRFRLLATLFVVLMIAGLLGGSVSTDYAGDPFFDLALASVAAGVILTESRLRSRERPRTNPHVRAARL